MEITLSPPAFLLDSSLFFGASRLAPRLFDDIFTESLPAAALRLRHAGSFEAIFVTRSPERYTSVVNRDR